MAVEMLKQQGYDAVVNPKYETIVFEPEQIQIIDQDVAKILDTNCRCVSFVANNCDRDYCPRKKRKKYSNLIRMQTEYPTRTGTNQVEPGLKIYDKPGQQKIFV